MGSKFPAIIKILLCSILTIEAAFAGPVGLPDSARPGAARPEQEGRGDIPSRPVADVIEVPAVIDRPFDVDEGEVIIITEFRFLDGEDLPEFDVSLDEINAILEEQKALRPEGFTIGQLQEVADAITNHYRSKGLILAQAVVPVQTVSGGTVDIQIYVGKLGRVLAEGNEMYVKEILEKPFQKLIGQPISKAKVEAALLTLTDYSGLSVFGVFQPGLHVGTADIVLKVQEEKRFDVAFRADDHGTRETGRNRLRTTVDWNNFTGFADRLTLSVQQSYNPKNNTFYGMGYERYLSNGFLVGGFVNKNSFDVGGEFASSQISAESKTQGVYLEKSFIRSRQRNFLSRFGFTRKKSQTTTAGRSTNRDRLAVFTLSADYDSLDSFSLTGDQGGGGINFASLEFSQGVNNLLSSMGSPAEATLLASGIRPSRQGGDDRFAAGKFNKVFGSYTRLQTIWNNHSLLFRSEFQWTNDPLTPLEQYSVGGPDNLRALPSAQVLWDRAYFFSFEWLVNAPGFADKPAFDNRTWGEILQVSAFFDQAVGRLNDPLETEAQRYNVLRGAGVGVRFTLPGMFESKLLWASEIGGEDVGNERNVQVWGDVTYRF
jgi:hemolysin activation/secretion protein